MMGDVLALVCARSALIGTARLRPLDKGLGIYGGPMETMPGYASVEGVIRRLMEHIVDGVGNEASLSAAFRERDSLGLLVRAGSGALLHPGAVHIEDWGPWLPEEDVWVELLEVPREEARAVFEAEPPHSDS